MKNTYDIQSLVSEFKWDEEKLIKKLLADWNPLFSPDNDFKSALDSKIQNKIKLTKEHQEEQAALDAVPRNLKWRFYLTWYWYAICTFLALFLIWFCTNIFTWTLNVPSKYNYIEEDQAFWNLEAWKELAYAVSDISASNFSYNNSYDEVEESIEEDSSNDAWIATTTNSVALAKTQALWATMNATENFLVNTSIWSNDIDIFMDDWFTYNETYRFAYKDKLFPKLSTEYPIYKSSGVLMWSNTPNQFLKNLKIWDVSFKSFQDLEIKKFEIEQDIDDGYTIVYDNNEQKLHFYPNSSWKANAYNKTLPSKKTITKNVEKNLKSLWVSLKNYWEAEISLDDFDENMWIVNIFYPFQIQWKSVRNPNYDEQIWMHIAYDLNLQKVVSVIWIDIATYDVSNYPVLNKKFIESEISQWWTYFRQGAIHENSTVILFKWMEIVYIEKQLESWEKVYIPAIKWTVTTSLDNYRGPSCIYEEII